MVPMIDIKSQCPRRSAMMQMNNRGGRPFYWSLASGRGRTNTRKTKTEHVFEECLPIHVVQRQVEHLDGNGL